MFRLNLTRVAGYLLLWIPTVCMAQGSMPSRVASVEILVRVTFQNDRSAGDQIRVELVNDMGVPV